MVNTLITTDTNRAHSQHNLTITEKFHKDQDSIKQMKLVP